MLSTSHRSVHQLLADREHDYGPILPDPLTDWDIWKVSEYEPVCRGCGKSTHAEAFRGDGMSWLFAICDQCGHAYEFDWR